jgi:uncharacterized membrane protein YeaQ/YmgE (transglycosylase-associated protein family)
VTPSTIDVAKTATGDQWCRRPVASALVRTTVLSFPLVVAVIAGVVAGSSVSGNSVGSIVARMALGAVASIVAFAIVERLARRFLPLAALLRLSLVFPDCAPSRFSVAMRATSVRKLQQWAKEAQGDDEIPALAEKVVTLASALNAHDRRTRGHSERSRAMADLITDELQMSPTEANGVRWGAFLHDIGKLLVPAEILNKPGAPTPREWTILQRHPAEGARLVEPLRPFLGDGVDAVGAHHEHYDGSGYPHGLSGEEIPLVARIVAVADSFEVMTAVRSYKRPMTAQAARSELVQKSGTQFDPRIVRAFLNVPLGRLHWALGIVAWVTEIPFLTVIPRAAAQVGAVTGGGTVLSTSALSSIATASLGAMVAAGPSVAHAAMSTSTLPTVSVQATSDRLAPTNVSPAAAAGPSENDAQPSSASQAADTPSATGVATPPVVATPVAGDTNASGPPSIGTTPSTADPASGQTVVSAAKGTTNSNAGGNGNGKGNGVVASASSNAGGNGNGAAASASANAGGNGNGAAASASANAGGNGNGNGAAASSNAGGNNGNGNGKGNGAAASSKKEAGTVPTTTAP